MENVFNVSRLDVRKLHINTVSVLQLDTVDRVGKLKNYERINSG